MNNRKVKKLKKNKKTNKKIKKYNQAIFSCECSLDGARITLNFYLKNFLNRGNSSEKSKANFDSAKFIYENLSKRIDVILNKVIRGSEISIESIKEEFKALRENPQLFVDTAILEEVKNKSPLGEELALFVEQGIVKETFYQMPVYPIHKQNLIIASLTIFEELIIFKRFLKMINYEYTTSKIESHLLGNLMRFGDIYKVDDIMSWFRPDDMLSESDSDGYAEVLEAINVDITADTIQRPRFLAITRKIDSLQSMLSSLHSEDQGILIDIMQEAKNAIEKNNSKLLSLSFPSSASMLAIIEMMNVSQICNSLSQAIIKVKNDCECEANEFESWYLKILKEELPTAYETIKSRLECISQLLQRPALFDKANKGLINRLNEQSEVFQALIHFICTGEHQHSSTLYMDLVDELPTLDEVAKLKNGLMKAKEAYIYAYNEKQCVNKNVDALNHKEDRAKEKLSEKDDSFARKESFARAFSFWKNIDANAAQQAGFPSQSLNTFVKKT